MTISELTICNLNVIYSYRVFIMFWCFNMFAVIDTNYQYRLTYVVDPYIMDGNVMTFLQIVISIWIFRFLLFWSIIVPTKKMTILQLLEKSVCHVVFIVHFDAVFLVLLYPRTVRHQFPCKNYSQVHPRKVSTSIAMSNNNGISQICQSLADRTRGKCVLGALNVLDNSQRKQTSSPDEP